MAAPRRRRGGGFTLIEQLVVLALAALASATVALALPDSQHTRLQREAQRLAAVLDAARAQARLTATPVRWQAGVQGVALRNTQASAQDYAWLMQPAPSVTPPQGVLGPEPVDAPLQLRLSLPGVAPVWLRSDGVSPIAVGGEAAP